MQNMYIKKEEVKKENQKNYGFVLRVVLLALCICVCVCLKWSAIENNEINLKRTIMRMCESSCVYECDIHAHWLMDFVIQFKTTTTNAATWTDLMIHATINQPEMWTSNKKRGKGHRLPKGREKRNEKKRRFVETHRKYWTLQMQMSASTMYNLCSCHIWIILR